MVIEEEEKDRRWYPTQTRFKKSNLFRPDFYLLSSEFYTLQSKILREIQRQIEPFFASDNQMTYEEYVEQIKEKNPHVYEQKYTNS